MPCSRVGRVRGVKCAWVNSPRADRCNALLTVGRVRERAQVNSLHFTRRKVLENKGRTKLALNNLPHSGYSVKRAMAAAVKPTIAQQRFAAGIASGKSQAAAYRLAHPGSKANAKTIRTKAARAAKSDHVQAEVTRLMRDPILLDFAPDAQDPDKLEIHAVATMVGLTRSSDGAIAGHAAMWLAEFAGTLRARGAQAAIVEPTAAEEQRRLISSLRGLYAKAINAPPLELTVESAAEPAPQNATQNQP